jgi:hypothetical protein
MHGRTPKTNSRHARSQMRSPSTAFDGTMHRALAVAEKKSASPVGQISQSSFECTPPGLAKMAALASFFDFKMRLLTNEKGRGGVDDSRNLNPVITRPNFSKSREFKRQSEEHQNEIDRLDMKLKAQRQKSQQAKGTDAITKARAKLLLWKCVPGDNRQRELPPNCTEVEKEETLRWNSYPWPGKRYRLFILEAQVCKFDLVSQS